MTSSNFTSTPTAFVGADGRSAADPLSLVSRPQVSLRALALMAANPVLDSNIGAPSPWHGVRRIRPTFDFSEVDQSEVGELRERFTAAVGRCLGSAETVVVLFSGGLDSLALLIEAVRQCTKDGRRLVPLVCDLVDDIDRPASKAAHEQASSVRGCPPVTVLPAFEPGEPEPHWSASGPRSECHTGFARRVYSLAQSYPDSVVIDGEGGDEALSAWNYGPRDLIAARRLPDLWHYLTAFARHQTLAEVIGEGLALASRYLSAERSFRWYLASAWPQLLCVDPGRVIGTRFQQATQDAHLRWLQERFAVFLDQRQDWEQAMFFDQVYPYAYDAHPVDAPVPHRSPYLDDDFLVYCAGLPWRERFDANHTVPYWWYKALQLRLIPEPLRGLAVRYKMRYTAESRRHLERTAPKGPMELVRLGVLRDLSYQTMASAHGFLPLVVRNTELWLRGALERGYSVVD